MTGTTAPPTRELLIALGRAFDGRSIASLTRRPHAYATSFALEELQVRFEDGGQQAVILKDLAWERLLGDAPRTKPAFLYEPRREILTQLRLLAELEFGPACYGAVADASTGWYWLLLEQVEGVELWQVGEPDTWAGVAAWLGRFHARSSGRVAEVRVANPFLLRLDAAWFRRWCERARNALGEAEDRRAASLRDALVGYGAVVDVLAALPPVFVHGELYPSNVLVRSGCGPLRVCPVDWEMAATGPGLIDLAALVGGWDAASRACFLTAYASTLDASRVPTAAELDCCRLHLALQWLGWSRDWQAPPEHGHDWIGEALEIAESLEL